MTKKPCQRMTFLKRVRHLLCFTGRGEEINGQMEISTNGEKYKIIEIMGSKRSRRFGTRPQVELGKWLPQ